MDKITSRKNEYIQSLKNYKGDDFLCCGEKMLKEAVKSGAEITGMLWKEEVSEEINCTRQYIVPSDLFDYVCPMKNSPGPLFTAKVNEDNFKKDIKSAIILENVQDPGNVGTVIRTANAMNIDCVYLVGDCASLKSQKVVSASMGAVFYQKVLKDCLPDLPIYGAMLDKTSVDILEADLKGCAVAIGSEGHGLSEDFLKKCSKKIIIPMSERAESLNAAIAASICMWEMQRQKIS